MAKKVKDPDFTAMKAKLDKDHSAKVGKLNKNVQKHIDKHNVLIAKLQAKLDGGRYDDEAEAQELRDSIAEKRAKVGELTALLSA